MKKNQLPKPISLLILTLLTSILWVGLGIYRTLTVKPQPAVPENVSRAITPNLNTNIIQKIESAVFFQDSEIPQINTSVGTPNIATPLPTETPIATSSAVPVASGSAAPTI